MGIMKDATILSIVAMLIIGILAVVALYFGVDGIALKASMAIIGGLVGFGVKTAIVKRAERTS